MQDLTPAFCVTPAFCDPGLCAMQDLTSAFRQRMVKLLLPTVIRPFTITPVDFISYQTANGCTADGGRGGASNDIASHPANGRAAQNASVALRKPRVGTTSQRCDHYRSSQNESTHFNLLDGKPLLEQVRSMSTLNEPPVSVTCLVHRALTCRWGIAHQIRERRLLSPAAVIQSAMQQAGGVHEMKIRTSHRSMVGRREKRVCKTLDESAVGQSKTTGP